MKKNNMTAFIIVSGLLVLIVFTVTLCLNLLPNYESDSYFAKPNDNMDSKIESIDIQDGKLNITTSGNPSYYCVKSTRTSPTINSFCWKEMNGNNASTSIFEYKKYYVWIKDDMGNISNYYSIDAK